MAKRKRTTPKRKRLPNRMEPVHTAVNFPKGIRELFEQHAAERHITVSYAVVLFVLDVIEPQRKR